jgi:hypothetical protein
LRAQRGYHPEIGDFELMGKDTGGPVRTFAAPDFDARLANLVLIRRS